MYYAILAADAADSLPARIQTRPKHLARLHALAEQGRLLTAGPLPNIDGEEPGAAGFSGSLIIAEFDSLQDAQAWADADPYVAAGVYEHIAVKPFIEILP